MQFLGVHIDESQPKPSSGLKTRCPGSLESREHVVVLVDLALALGSALDNGIVPRVRLTRSASSGSPSLLGGSRRGAETAEVG